MYTGYNRTHLTALTINVITAGQLNSPLTELLISDTNFEKAVTEIKEC